MGYMQYVMDPQYARVISVRGKRGGKFGFAEVLDEDRQPTGEPAIWFHFNDRCDLELIGGDLSWIDPRDEDGRVPVEGDIIVFEEDKDMQDRSKASPWQYAEDYDVHMAYKTAVYFQIVMAGRESPVWSGWFSRRLSSPLVGDELPQELVDGMTIQEYRDDDTWDNTSGLSGLIPGGWETCHDQESVWIELVAASNRR